MELASKHVYHRGGTKLRIRKQSSSFSRRGTLGGTVSQRTLQSTRVGRSSSANEFDHGIAEDVDVDQTRLPSERRTADQCRCTSSPTRGARLRAGLADSLSNCNYRSLVVVWKGPRYPTECHQQIKKGSSKKAIDTAANIGRGPHIPTVVKYRSSSSLVISPE